MRYVNPPLAGLIALGIAVISCGWLISGPLTSHAVQNPEMHFDMVTTGNSYSNPGPELTASDPFQTSQCGYLAFPGGPANNTDDDADGVVNDGCPTAGASPESGPQCANAIDDDTADDESDGAYPGAPAPGLINDGCPTAGNNSMAVGTINNCLATGGAGSTITHFHNVHLILRNTEDLVSWTALEVRTPERNKATAAAAATTARNRGAPIVLLRLITDTSSIGLYWAVIVRAGRVQQMRREFT